MGLRQDIIISRKPLAGFVAVGLTWSIYFAQMPAIKASVGASDGAYGVVVLIGSLGALSAMWLAPFCQRMLRDHTLPVAIALSGFGMLWAGQAGGLVVLALSMVMASAGSGITDVLVNARVSELESRATHSLMSLNHAIYSFAYAGGALVTGALRSAGWPPSAVLAGLFVVLLLLAWASHDVAPELDETDTPEDGGVPHRLVTLVGLIVLIAFLAEAAAEGWSALHLERTLGGSPAEGALGPALLGLTMGFGRLTGHALARHVRDTTLMALSMLVAATGLIVAALATSVVVALGGFALMGLGISLVAPLALALVGRVVPPAARLTSISRASVLGYGAFFLGPPLMGFVSEGFGLRASFGLISVTLVIAAATLIPALVRRLA